MYLSDPDPFLNDKKPCRYGSPDAQLPVPKGAVIEDDVVSEEVVS